MIYYQCRAHTNRMIDSAEDLLSRKHMVRTILLLRSRKAITQSDINGYVSNWKIVKERADALRESGLAEETLVREGKMVMKYRITPQGSLRRRPPGGARPHAQGRVRVRGVRPAGRAPLRLQEVLGRQINLRTIMESGALIAS